MAPLAAAVIQLAKKLLLMYGVSKVIELIAEKLDIDQDTVKKILKEAGLI